LYIKLVSDHNTDNNDIHYAEIAVSMVERTFRFHLLFFF